MKDKPNQARHNRGKNSASPQVKPASAKLRKDARLFLQYQNAEEWSDDEMADVAELYVEAARQLGVTLGINYEQSQAQPELDLSDFTAEELRQLAVELGRRKMVVEAQCRLSEVDEQEITLSLTDRCTRSARLN
jgi:hypothetical protein